MELLKYAIIAQLMERWNYILKAKQIEIHVEIKKDLRPYQLPDILEKQTHYTPLMVVAERIFPALKQELRNRGIGYLDTVGNIYIEQNGTII